MVLVANTAAAPCGEEAIRLASDKSALAEIMMPDKAGPAEQYAAQELSDYLCRICDACLPTVVAPNELLLPHCNARSH